MFEFLADKISITVLAISQLLLSNVAGTDPRFEDVQLAVEGPAIYLSTHLMDSFTEDLDMILQSGDTLILHFEVDLVDMSTDSPVAIGTWQHEFRYSLLEDRYQLYSSETERNRNIYDFEEAKRRWVRIEQARLCDLDDLNDDSDYFLRMSAFMDPVDMPGLTEQMNLMAFWNQIRPVYKSQPFQKRSLVLQ